MVEGQVATAKRLAVRERVHPGWDCAGLAFRRPLAPNNRDEFQTSQAPRKSADAL